MACESMTRRNQPPAVRRNEVKESLARLEAALMAGAVSVKVAPNGAVAFVGWGAAQRDDVSDACAFRALQARSSAPFRQALARAEALAGRKADPRAVAAGWHSHDGGQTWGTHRH